MILYTFFMVSMCTITNHGFQATNDHNATEKASVANSSTITNGSNTYEFNHTTESTAASSAATDATVNQESTETTTPASTLSTTKPTTCTPCPDPGQEHPSETSSLSMVDSPNEPTPCDAGPPGPTKCVSKQCYAEASKMLYKMNHTADKCQNFYEYACGGIKGSLTDDSDMEDVWKVMKGELAKIYEKRSESEIYLKTFYTSCLNHGLVPPSDSKAAGKALLSSVGQMYTSYQDVPKLTDTIATLIQLNSFPLFDVGLEVNGKDPTKLLLFLSAPFQDSLFMLKNEKEIECMKVLKNHTYLNQVYENAYAECIGDYTNYIKTMREALREFDLLSHPEDEDIIIQHFQNKTIDVLQHAPSVGKTIETKSKMDYETMNVENLQEHYGMIDWKMLFSLLVDVEVESSTEIHVYGSKYFHTINVALHDEKELWKVHNSLLANLAHNVYEYFVKVKSGCNRENYCLQMASRLMPDVFSNLYMKSFTRKELLNLQHEATSLFSLIQNTMLMEAKSESNGYFHSANSEFYKNVVNKTKAFKVSLPISSLTKLKSDDEFMARTKESESLDSCPYLTQAMRLLKRQHRLVFSTYTLNPNTPAVVWTLFARSFSTKSVYIYGINTLAIPQELIARHGRNKDLPAAMRLARLGHTIAKGLGSAFDSKGLNFNCQNLFIPKAIINYMTDELDDYEFNKFKADSAFVYNTFYIEDGVSYSFKPNPTISMNERLSDVTATFLSLIAIQKYDESEHEIMPWGDFSYEQLFFITLAQGFCSKSTVRDSFPGFFEKETLPPFMRVMIMLSHSEDFVKAYQCKAGAKMNSGAKIDPFPLRVNMDF